MLLTGEMERTGYYDAGDRGKEIKLWWSGKGDGAGGVGVMVKEELCEKVVEVSRVNDSDDGCCSF